MNFILFWFTILPLLFSNSLIWFKLFSFSEFLLPLLISIFADTSGLLLVAKTDDIHAYLSEEISKRKVSRKYIALCHGVIKNDTGLTIKQIMIPVWQTRLFHLQNIFPVFDVDF